MGICKDRGLIYQDPNILRRAKPVNVAFTRNSEAYDDAGNSLPINTPRFRSYGGVYVEPTTGNILSSDASLLITNAAPYTTESLNGTYSFSCKTGSITLSGGASGTVTPSTPVTVAVSNATVTLTPADTSTFNQVELKAYATGWHIGGGTRAAA